MMLLLLMSMFQLAPPASQEDGSLVWQHWIDDLDIRIILVGESHGYEGAPLLTGEIVEAAAAVPGRRILLLVESTDREAYQSYLHSDGGSIARDQLINHTDIWSQGIDGRQTRAVFDYLERVRQLVSEGAEIDAFAVIPQEWSSLQGRWDPAGAEMVRDELSSGQYDLAIGLIGNAHTAVRYPMGRENHNSSFGAELGGEDVRAMSVSNIHSDGRSICRARGFSPPDHDLYLCMPNARSKFMNEALETWRLSLHSDN